jgi:hypothetical protein
MFDFSTLSTRASIGPDLTAWSKAESEAGAPVATTSTRPSGRFLAQPRKSSADARRMTNQRNPTP